MAKFIPKKTETVDACQWLYSVPEDVADFFKFTGEHNLAFSLCPGIEGGVAAEICKEGVYHFDVEPYEYLIVEADGTIKHMEEGCFNDEFGKVS